MDSPLSELQSQILQNVAGGYSTERILLKLGISYREYRKQIEILKFKLEARSVQEAVVRAHDLGLMG